MYGYRLRNIENDEQMVFYTNIGSPWFNTHAEAEKWLHEREEELLTGGRIQRGGSIGAFMDFENVDDTAVFDRQPLVGTGPLPNWLRNFWTH